MSDSDRKLLRGLAIYEIVGGLIGIALVLICIVSQLTFGNIFMCSLAALFYVLSIVAGAYLWREDLQIGKRLSFFIQGLQLISFAVGGLGYLFSAGFKLSLFVNLTHGFNIGLQTGLSDFHFLYSNSPFVDNASVALNFAPIVIVYQLDKLIKRIEHQQKMEQDIRLMQNNTPNSNP